VPQAVVRMVLMHICLQIPSGPPSTLFTCGAHTDKQTSQ